MGWDGFIISSLEAHGGHTWHMRGTWGHAWHIRHGSIRMVGDEPPPERSGLWKMQHKVLAANLDEM